MKLHLPRTLKLGVVISLGLVAVASGASALIGDTPPSPSGYSGVARQTTGRASATEKTSVAATGVVPVAASTTVTTLPAGCAEATIANVVYRKCGVTYYRPYTQGGNVVYVPATP